MKVRFTLFSVLLLASISVFAQGTTGSLTGTVLNQGSPLPGVTVVISSPAMQGSRTTITNEAGTYNFAALPPGQYTARAEMEGMSPATQTTRVNLGSSSRVDLEMNVSSISEAITVTASSSAVVETTEVQSNYTADLIEDLPIARTLVGATSLAPGVVAGTNGLAISGANSFDNLWTVNGAVVNENIRGQPHNLFIEDAIQETTIQTAGVSAEYGNFTGGVINAITKSGGNQFSGSIRDSITNPSWTAASSFRNPTTGAAPADPIDQNNDVYEGTLGGRIVRDRLWFFLAGRQAETGNVRAFSNSELTFVNTITDERLEVKLTGAITPSHSLVASYLEAPVEEANNCQIGCFDITTVNPARSLPNDFRSAQYNGIFGSQFLLEARYSAKTFQFVNSGGLDQNLATGTPVRLVAPGFATVTNEPYFCGSCGPEARDNDSIALKGTYFLGTKSLGTHNIVAGGEKFHETRLANNFQSPTGFVGFFRTFAPTRGPDGNALISVGNNDILIHFPILKLSEGSDLNTNGYYINDKWDLNDKVSLQLGVRYDKNDSRDSSGNANASDDKISPRLGVAYDLFANGRLRLNASYGVYVNRLSEGVSGAGSAAGNPATFQYLYGGAPITSKPAPEAMATVFAWLASAGGLTALPPCSATITTGCLLAQSVPGFNSRLDGTLISPSVDEYTLGVGTQFAKGYFRADYIHRDWQDFYTQSASLDIGSVTSSTGARADLFLTHNSDDFERTYDAIELQGQYRLLDRVNIGANYTWSELEGNVVGETTGNGPVSTGGKDFYKEYLGFAQNSPSGFLPQDQTHKLRVWAGIDIPTFLGDFNVSALQRFDSGTPYSLVGTVNPSFSANFYGPGLPGGVVNPGYVSARTAENYFFSDRGEFRFDDQTATDLSVNYATKPGWLFGVQFFAQGEVINVFDEDAMTGFDTSILTAANTTTLQRFNPLAGDVPVENVHWRKGPNFGKPTNDYTVAAPTAQHVQTPRTYRVSLGLRF
ncbi:MAG: TonB-dependent receptor [Acidobacteriota bacterium]|nr:TonB-dependent receptor [Acidobacteriota bacterium]